MPKRHSKESSRASKAAKSPVKAASSTSSKKGKKTVSGDPVAMTLRISRESYRQLKILGLDEDATSQELLTEGLNLLFKKRGLPPIA